MRHEDVDSVTLNCAWSAAIRSFAWPASITMHVAPTLFGEWDPERDWSHVRSRRTLRAPIRDAGGIRVRLASHREAKAGG
jgi:hypothetical protein